MTYAQFSCVTLKWLSQGINPHMHHKCYEQVSLDCAHLLSVRSFAMLLQFGVYLAYALVAYCYFGVAFTGYHAFGSMTGDQILYSLGHPIWVVCLASVMVIVHVCGSFQVTHSLLAAAMPALHFPVCIVSTAERCMHEHAGLLFL